MSTAELAPVIPVEAPDPNNALNWPEHSPSVSVDVGLRSLGKRIDFDMPTYNALLDRNRVGPERSDLKISLVPVIPYNATANGKYDLRNNKIFVDVKTGKPALTKRGREKRKIKLINKTVRHETEHYLQGLKGAYRFDEAEARKFARKNKDNIIKLGDLSVNSSIQGKH